MEKSLVNQELPFRGEIDFSPLPIGNVEDLFTIGEGTGHLGSELIGSSREFAMTSGADEFDLLGRQPDILRSGNHELLGTLRTVHDRMKQFFAGGEP